MAPFAEFFVRQILIVPGDAAQTVSNIMAGVESEKRTQEKGGFEESNKDRRRDPAIAGGVGRLRAGPQHHG